MFAIRHVLVPTDFSDASERALATAVELARAFEARLTLLHVWSLPNAGYAEALAWPVEAMEKAAQKALDEAVARVNKVLSRTEAVLQVGTEHQRILEVVKERHVDFVVMGTHGRRGLPRLVLGSVAGKVVRLCPVPVLTVGEVHAPPTSFS
jgi:nucleotide-binding universal stress UspA family protein